MKSVLFGVFALLSMSIVSANADELSATSAAFCQKMKGCILSNPEIKNLSPDMQKLLTAQMKTMCTEIHNNFTPTDKSLKDEALSCVRSLSAMSCQSLMALEAEEAPTPACRKYQNEALKAQ